MKSRLVKLDNPGEQIVDRICRVGDKDSEYSEGAERDREWVESIKCGGNRERAER